MFLARVFFFPHSRARARKEEEENCISRFALIRGTRVSWMRRSFHSSFCFLFSLGDTKWFLYLGKVKWQMNEKTLLGKNGQRGFEYTGEFWLARASFFPFFSCSFLCRRRLRISSFFFIEEEEVNDDYVVWKEQTLGKIPTIQFFETDSSTSGVWLAQNFERVCLPFFWGIEKPEGNAIYTLHYNLTNKRLCELFCSTYYDSRL